MSHIFKYKQVPAPNGGIFHQLTADDYPYINMQVVTFSPEQRDEVTAALIEREGMNWVKSYPGRNDFVVIHAGGQGLHPLNVTQANVLEVLEAMRQCLQHAAEAWATGVGIHE